MLTKDQAERIAKFVRLLASEHDGEVLAAARMLTSYLAKQGLSMNDLGLLIEQIPKVVEIMAEAKRGAYNASPPPPPKQDTSKVIETVRDAVDFCVMMKDKLQPREREFIESVSEQFYRKGKLSPRQQDWLKAIATKLMRIYGYTGGFADVS